MDLDQIHDETGLDTVTVGDVREYAREQGYETRISHIDDDELGYFLEGDGEIDGIRIDIADHENVREYVGETEYPFDDLEVSDIEGFEDYALHKISG